METKIKSAYEQVPFSKGGMSHLTFRLKGWFSYIASSLEPENARSMKMHKYIRFDLVGFFFD